MYQIEVAGKQIVIDTSQVSIGDFMDALAAYNSGDKGRQALSFYSLLKKTLGDQVYLIPVANYAYVLDQIVLAVTIPFQTDQVTDEIEEIISRSEEKNKGA